MSGLLMSELTEKQKKLVDTIVTTGCSIKEVEQMALFKDMVCYQEEVRDPSRVAEVLNRVISKAFRGSAPAQINVPRDMWTQVVLWISLFLPRTRNEQCLCTII